MFNLKACHDEMLWTETITATIFSCHAHLTINFSGNRLTCHISITQWWSQAALDSHLQRLRFAQHAIAILV